MEVISSEGAINSTGCGTSTKRTLSEESVNTAEKITSPVQPYKTPDCLLALHISTAGKQGDNLGCDELPIVMLTAKILDLNETQSSGPEFQVYIRPITFEVNPNGSIDPTETPKVENDPIHSEKLHSMNQTSVVLTDGSSFSSGLQLTQECTLATGLNDEFLAGGVTLQEGLDQLHSWITDQGLIYQEADSVVATEQQLSVKAHEPVTGVKQARIQAENNAQVNKNSSTERPSRPRSFVILTDGPNSLRLVLHPETTKRSILLNKFIYFYKYIDLRKSVKKYCNSDTLPRDLGEMLNCVGICCRNNESCENGFVTPAEEDMDCTITSPANPISSGDSNSQTDLPHPNVRHSAMGEFIVTDAGQYCIPKIGFPQREHCKRLCELALHLHTHGYSWTDVETIYRQYQPSIVRKDEVVEDNVVVRARGLPWQATDLDIFHFFSGLNISDGGISLVLSKIGRRNGEALVRFSDQEQRDLALRKHKHHMGQRYVEIYAAQGREFIAFAGAETTEAEQFLRKFTSPYQALIRMRGLPYTTTVQQILQFFSNTNCEVQFGEEGVLFVNRRNGRATGDAFVMFETQAIAEKALQNHWQHIGNRYIELFKSTPAEVNQVMNAVLNSPIAVPRGWNKLTLDVKSALTAAALAVGVLPDNLCSPSSIDQCSQIDGTLESTMQLNLTPQQPLNVGYPLFGTNNLLTSYITPTQANSLFFAQHLPGYPPVPIPTMDPLLSNVDLMNPFGNLAVNQTLLANASNGTDQLTTKLTGFNGAMTIPLNCPPLTSLVSTTFPTPSPINFSNLTPADAQTEQLARCFIRIRGMPLDADIMDILTFLEDSWRYVALHGVHQVYTTTGQSTGEALIQFVSEFVARFVAEQKNNKIFIKRGMTLTASTCVEVAQCTREDLKQLLQTITNIMQTNEAFGTMRPLTSHSNIAALLPKTGLPQTTNLSLVGSGPGWINLPGASNIKDMKPGVSTNQLFGNNFNPKTGLVPMLPTLSELPPAGIVPGVFTLPSLCPVQPSVVGTTAPINTNSSSISLLGRPTDSESYSIACQQPAVTHNDDNTTEIMDQTGEFTVKNWNLVNDMVHPKSPRTQSFHPAPKQTILTQTNGETQQENTVLNEVIVNPSTEGNPEQPDIKTSRKPTSKTGDNMIVSNIEISKKVATGKSIRNQH